MRRALIATVLMVASALASGCGAVDAGVPAAAAAPLAHGAAAHGSVLRGTYTRLNGKIENLKRYRGKVVLVVNTATECGFTPEFAGLQKLYAKDKAKGLVLLGFPSNDFAQEPRGNKQIETFCKANFGVNFPMFAKTTVTGPNANPLYKVLDAAAGQPEWNFNKFLIDRHGHVVTRYTSEVEPDAPLLTNRINALLTAT